MLEKADRAKKTFRLVDLLNKTLDRLSAEIDELTDAELRSLDEQGIEDRRRLIRLDLADLSASYEYLRRAGPANPAAAN
jgi:hypothetical protein